MSEIDPIPLYAGLYSAYNASGLSFAFNSHHVAGLIALTALDGATLARAIKLSAN